MTKSTLGKRNTVVSSDYFICIPSIYGVIFSEYSMFSRLFPLFSCWLHPSEVAIPAVVLVPCYQLEFSFFTKLSLLMHHINATGNPTKQAVRKSNMCNTLTFIFLPTSLALMKEVVTYGCLLIKNGQMWSRITAFNGLETFLFF